MLAAEFGLCSVQCYALFGVCLVKCDLSRESGEICSFLKVIFHLLHLPDTIEICVAFKYHHLLLELKECRTAVELSKSFLCLPAVVFRGKLQLELGSGSLVKTGPWRDIGPFCLHRQFVFAHRGTLIL